MKRLLAENGKLSASREESLNDQVDSRRNTLESSISSILPLSWRGIVTDRSSLLALSSESHCSAESSAKKSDLSQNKVAVKDPGSNRLVISREQPCATESAFHVQLEKDDIKCHSDRRNEGKADVNMATTNIPSDVESGSVDAVSFHRKSKEKEIASLDFFELDRQLSECRELVSDENAAVSELRDRLCVLRAALVFKSEYHRSQADGEGTQGICKPASFDWTAGKNPTSQNFNSHLLHFQSSNGLNVRSQHNGMSSQDSLRSNLLKSESSDGLRRLSVTTGSLAQERREVPHDISLHLVNYNLTESLQGAGVFQSDQILPVLGTDDCCLNFKIVSKESAQKYPAKAAAQVLSMIRALADLHSDFVMVSASFQATDSKTATQRSGQGVIHQRNQTNIAPCSHDMVSDGTTMRSKTDLMKIEQLLKTLIQDQQEVRLLWDECVSFVQKQSAGRWDDKDLCIQVKPEQPRWMLGADMASTLRSRLERTQAFAFEIIGTVLGIELDFQEVLTSMKDMRREQDVKLQQSLRLVDSLQTALASEKSQSLLITEVFQRRLKETEDLKNDLEVRMESTGSQLATILGALGGEIAVSRPNRSQSSGMKQTPETQEETKLAYEHLHFKQRPASGPPSSMALNWLLHNGSFAGASSQPENSRLNAGQSEQEHTFWMGCTAQQTAFDDGLDNSDSVANEKSRAERQERPVSLPSDSLMLRHSEQDASYRAPETDAGSRLNAADAAGNHWKSVLNMKNALGAVATAKRQSFKGAVQSI